MKKTLFLVRHAQPEFPGGIPICMGQTYDYPLSAEGIRQAEAMAEALSVIPLEGIYTSPLKRCTQTAASLARHFGTEPIILQNLAELQGGVWDGMSLQAMHEQYPDYFSIEGNKTPPGGESNSEGLKRILKALDEVSLHTVHYAVLVTHSAIGRVLLSSLLGGNSRHIPMEYASITPLLLDDKGVHLESLPLNAFEFSKKIRGHCLC